MNTEERSTTLPGKFTEQKCSVHNLPTENFPDYVDTFFDSGSSPRYEKRRQPFSGGPKSWNPFEHYRSDQAKPGSAQGAGIVVEAPGNMTNVPPNHTSTYLPFVSAGYDQYTFQGALSQPFGDAGRLDADLPPFIVEAEDGSFVPPPNDLINLTHAALAAMLPVIKAELSLPNFLIELKDFKRPLLKSAEYFRSGVFINAIRKLGLRSNETFQQLIRRAAGSYLNLSFNLLPFISDVGKIRLAMSRTERRLNDFITRSGSPQNRHYVRYLHEFPDRDDSEVSGGSATSNSFWDDCFSSSSRKVTYEESTFHCQIQYNYNYTGYQLEHARMLAQLDSLGLNLNPAIIWNAIPWSFVVDWVAGIGPFLDSLKTENMKPMINIRRYLWSISRKRRITVTKSVRLYRTGTLIASGQMPVVVQTAYRRSVGIPTSSSIALSGLNPKEFSLGAALVIARRRRRHNR
jgi:hypothetical protein